MTRPTFVAPMFPEPTVLMSIPPSHFAVRYPKGIEPIK